MPSVQAADPVSDIDQRDWSALLENLAYANSKPLLTALIKQSPEHFVVTEQMDIEASGEGEHILLDITKIRRNTDAVAKSLARFAGVANRDVGYSGLKDFDAVTRQWFSVWRPKGDALDWSDYQFDGVTINQISQHSRKIKRGTHRSNHFEIRLCDLQGEADFDNSNGSIEELLNTRLEQLKKHGAPNYFGPQRFGRNAGNMQQVLAMFTGKKRIKDRSLRSILLSSARSWLFNSVVSERVKQQCWQQLFKGELANLDSTNSIFSVDDVAKERERLDQLDIHPTAPMWGQDSEQSINSFADELRELESRAMLPFADLQTGLENARLDYQRRPLRVVAKQLTWHYETKVNSESGSEQVDCVLTFNLSRGQFATSVLRELVVLNTNPR